MRYRLECIIDVQDGVIDADEIEIGPQPLGRRGCYGWRHNTDSTGRLADWVPKIQYNESRKMGVQKSQWEINY